MPVEDSGYAIGIVARADGRGRVLGYFFGPRYDAVPALSEDDLPTREKAILVAIFGDLGLIEREWPVILRPSVWRPSDWPMPDFGHIDVVDPSKAYRRSYDENTLEGNAPDVPITPEAALRLPRDAQSGSGAIEIKLTRLLASSP